MAKFGARCLSVLIVLFALASDASAQVGSVNLAWDASADSAVTGYLVSYGTTSRVYTRTLDATNRTTASLTGLGEGQRYYFAVQAYTAAGIRSAFSGEVTTIINSGVPAELVSPAAGSLIGSSTQTFTWNAGTNVTGYWIDLGRTQGGYEIRQGYVGASQSLTVSNLPLTGGPLWMRLRSLINGVYQIRDYQFSMLAASPAKIVSPVSGARLPDSTATFAWDAGVGAQFYWVNVGSSQGGYEYYSNYVGTSRQLTVSGLPLDGRNVWVRLMSYIGGAYQSVDYRFVAAVPGPARIEAPTLDATIGAPAQAFLWSKGIGATAYWVNVGSTQGGYEFYSNFVGQSRGMTVTGLPMDGRDIWVRLMSLINGEWQAVDHHYQAPMPRAARITSPAAAATLSGPVQTFNWDAGVGVSFYWVNVGSTQGGYEYYSNYVGQSQSLMVSGLPINGRPVWVRLMSYINGAYQSVDHQFLAATPGPARIVSPSVGATLGGATQTFNWSPGVGAQFYWVNVGTTQGGYEYYSNFVGQSTSLTLSNLPVDGRKVWVRLMSYIDGAYQTVDHQFNGASPRASVMLSPSTRSTLTSSTQTFQWDAGVAVSGYWLDIGTSQGGYDLYSNYVGATTSLTLNNLPLGGDIWVRLYSRIGDRWEITEYKYSTAQ
jgi:serine protease